jgi:CRP-like cAMP-binding protein
MAKRASVPRLPAGARPRNRILAKLPEEDFRRLRPALKTIPTRARQVLHRRGELMDHVYFPNGGVASVTAVLSDGTMVETATIGDEGMVGIEALFSEGAVAPGETMIQVPDTSAEMMTVQAFRTESVRGGALADLMGRYAQIVIAQMMQSAACNARHQVQERCCRWLLMTHDRMHQQDFQLSHEFLAVMLGVRRQTVTVVAGQLQTAGLIRYTHGSVTVLNREGLERASCECYGVIRSHFDRLFT